jgi:peptidoglycan/LPS O-acetylase OafA/YrhL
MAEHFRGIEPVFMTTQSEGRFTSTSTTYRPDIDGLRAVAVVAVLAFHVGTLHMTGGYVGVDVFFVISGFLISSIIFNDIAASRFSIAGFYERRIRRIFPALYALLLAYSIFACVYLLPGDLIEYAKTLIATTLSGSNIYLWTQSGYFDHRNSNPLMHTWSLAVEEQFYILFPLFLVLVGRFFPRRLRASVFIITLVSLALSAIVTAKSPDTAFYMPFTRAWELLLGTIVALGVFPRLRSAWVRNAIAAAGMGMILYSVLFYTSVTSFPGISALLPCLGSALIIGAGMSGESVTYRILAWRPVVFVGLISYSLYLWHWPVIMMYRMGFVDISSWFERHFGNRFHPDRFDHSIQILVSFVLAFLSWRFVEQPFRKGRLKIAFPRRRLFYAAAAFAVLFIAFAGVAIGSSGLKARFPPDAVQVASYLDNKELRTNEHEERLGVCFLDATTGVMNFDFSYCLQEEPGVKNYLLLGDSHAAAIWPALRSSIPGANVMQVNVTACPPTLSDHFVHSLCKKVMDYVYGVYLPSHPVGALLLESDWSASMLDALDQTLRWAKEHNVRVIVLGCVPVYDAPLARLLAYSIAWNDLGLAGRHLLASQNSLEPRLRTLVTEKWHDQFISLYDSICPDGACIEYADLNGRIPMMDDSHHLNRFGAQVVITRLINSGQLH